MAIMNNNKNNSVTINISEQETETKETVSVNETSERNRHDKRYEEPFENDGAYADDDID